MSCEAMQEGISALLDGERADVSQEALAAHLESCAECARWREGAHEVTRRFRLASAAWPPSPDPALLTAVDDASGPAPWASPAMLTRLALVAVALLQLVVTVPPLVLGSDRGAPIHVAHEMGSFDMALAAGFLAAAWKPAWAHGMQALVGVAAALLVLTALIDIAMARTSLGDELPHLLVVAGWLLLTRLAKLTPIYSDAPSTSLRLPMRRRHASAAGILAAPAFEQASARPASDALPVAAGQVAHAAGSHGEQPEDSRLAGAA